MFVSWCAFFTTFIGSCAASWGTRNEATCLGFCAMTLEGAGPERGHFTSVADGLSPAQSLATCVFKHWCFLQQFITQESGAAQLIN